MNKLINYLLFGIVGYKVFQNAKGDISKLQDWDYRIKDIFFSGVTANQIQGMVVWDFVNKSPQAGGWDQKLCSYRLMVWSWLSLGSVRMV
jgi:hypothetical protein